LTREQTLVLVKPDGVLRGLTGEIISRLERSTLKVVALKLVHANKEQAAEHYIEDEKWLLTVGEKATSAAEKRGEKVTETPLEIGNRVRNLLITYISMSPVVAIILEGNNAVAKVRTLVGETSPEHAAPGTIRGDLATDSYGLADSSKRPVQNIIHASGTVDEAQREISLWFTDKEIFEYDRIEDTLVYRRGDQ